MKCVKPALISGSVTAPPSKSQTIRAVAAGCLAAGTTRILNPAVCEDAAAAVRAAAGLGAEIAAGENGAIVLKAAAGEAPAVLDCGESGLCLRLFAPIAALRCEPVVLAGSGSLRCRPVGPLEPALRRLGAFCTTEDGYPPVKVRGPLCGGRAAVDGSAGSQILSGLLMALPLCPADSELEVSDLASRPYALMTLRLLEKFGARIETDPGFARVRIRGRQVYRARTIEIEGDWSGAAFLLVAGALAGRATVSGLDPASSQPDRRICEVLADAGARVHATGRAVTVEHGRLRGFTVDAADCPDLFPPLAVLACGAAGRSRIAGVRRLAHKESDRGRALVEELGSLGARIRIDGDAMEIEGGPLGGGIVDARGDHRIAMAGAVAGLIAPSGTMVKGWACVAKSYPGFFTALRDLGGDVA